MKKQEEGQAAIFLVIGILIVLIALIIYFLPSKTDTKEQPSDPLTIFITSCLHQAGTDAIRHVAATGGTAQQQEPTQVPPIQDIEKAIAKQTERLLPKCYDEFRALSQQGIQTQAEQQQVTALISQGTVYLTLRQTMTLIQNEQKKKLDHFVAEISTPLKESIDAARALQQHHEEGTDITPIIQNNINATFLTTDKTYAIIEFPINGIPDPGRWWVQVQ